MPDLPFTSIELESGELVNTRECAEKVAGRLAANLERELSWVDYEELLN
jgi:hypothetical protein